MFTKVILSAFVAFAATAQATLPGGQYGYKNETSSTSTVIVSPIPVTSAGPTGTAPVGTAPTESRPSIPISTGVSPSSGNSPIMGTGSAGPSSVHGPYPTGPPISAFGPIGTGPIGTGTGVSTAYTTETIDTTVTSDTTLTYTVGSGSQKTVVTTTVRHTSTKTMHSVSSESLQCDSPQTNMRDQTRYATKSASAGENGASSGGNNSPVDNAGSQGGASSAAGNGPMTSTISTTSTSTHYITVSATASSGAGAKNDSPLGAGGAGGSCAPQVTVTVSGPAQTVTVVSCYLGMKDCGTFTNYPRLQMPVLVWQPSQPTTT